MFGDIGHGFLLMLFGAYLCIYNEKIKKSDSMFKVLLVARHMFLMMGFFGTYNGLIYNEYLSLPLNLFGSCYELGNRIINGKEEGIWIKKNDCTYPFGIDPVWLCSSNSLTFINSYKMKLSVLIAVVHMVFGIIMKGLNARFFKNSLDFFWEFIP
jgi:V-type H+-transporting ATPase subunit a